MQTAEICLRKEHRENLGAHRENSVTSFIPYCPTLISSCPGSSLAEYCRLTLFCDASLVIQIQESQQTQGERVSARKEELEQEKQLIAQLEKQLQAETEEIEVLRQEKQCLQEEREELELESAWQQHQMELEAAHVPGAVLPELVEAQLTRRSG
ncbi:rho guanine nucleotide exchange factor 18-like [Meleagris gallopavo]|uniref:rho guanine nucleotide exchange factor 18-like n=1 Tax=Meleagris gallopavo TaxID=9103 RepID=UPI0012ABD8C5|nr:rho guanine nucleotide exchange factor 18-like [Meleagris gallopavo]